MSMLNQIPVKSGLKTTEFYLTLAGNIAAITATVAGVLPSKWAAIAMVISNGLYTISRAFAKL